jgi:hypothetical protein
VGEFINNLFNWLFCAAGSFLTWEMWRYNPDKEQPKEENGECSLRQDSTNR